MVDKFSCASLRITITANATGKDFQICNKFIYFRKDVLYSNRNDLYTKYISSYKGLYQIQMDWSTSIILYFLSGFGLFSANQIAAGSFICFYEGEELSVEEGTKRIDATGNSTYIFFIQFRKQEFW